jgi:hypothetical protein
LRRFVFPPLESQSGRSLRGVILSAAKNLVRTTQPRKILRCAQNDGILPIRERLHARNRCRRFRERFPTGPKYRILGSIFRPVTHFPQPSAGFANKSAGREGLLLRTP